MSRRSVCFGALFLLAAPLCAEAPGVVAITAATAEPTAASLAVREVTPSDADLEAKRATGVTTVLTVPSSGIFNGQSAILNLGEGSIESRVIRAAATQQVSFNPRAAWTYPDSLMGVIAYIKQGFLDAQQNAAALAIYEKSPGGNKRPDQSAAADALAAVLRREVPVVFIADSELMMRRAMAIGNEFKLR